MKTQQDARAEETSSVLEQTTGLSTRTSQSRIVSWLLARTRGVRAMWLLSVSSRVLNQLLTVVILTLAVSVFLNAPLIPTLGWIAGLSLIKAVFRYLEHYAGHWVAFTMLARLRTEFYNAIVPQAPAVVKGNAAAELSERATRDIDRIEVFFAHTVPPAIAAIVVPTISTLAVGWHLGWNYALVIALSSILMVIGPAVGRLASWKANRDLAAVNAEISIHLGDSVQGLREVLSFGIGERRLFEWEQVERAAERIRSRIRIRAAIRAFFLVLVELGTLVVLVGIVSEGEIRSALLACAIWVSLWMPLRGVDDFADGLDEALASAERVRACVETPPLVPDNGHHPLPEMTNETQVIAVDNVSFSYDGRNTNLDSVSFDLSGGTWTYIAGISGGGKSTLASLLARGWDPSTGTIRYRGTDLHELPLEDLRARVMLVVQRPSLLSGSLRDNLRLSAPQADDEALWEALHLVNLGEWATSNDGGLDTVIEADGANMSGGQIQRLAIARALVASPDVLILDEAMSQLDEATAHSVRSNIRAACPQMTVVEISHQVDRIPSDAQVLVIDAGRLVEQGNAGVLREDSCGFFSRLMSRA